MMMASCRSSVASQIKGVLTADQVVRFYGFLPGRAGFMPCPFHQGDHTASLKLYSGDGGWHCFGCGKGGSVIDFVMELFGVSFRQAVLRLNNDFSLGLSDEKPSTQELNEVAAARRREAEKLNQYRNEYQARTTLYRSMWAIKQFGASHPAYAVACQQIDTLDYWFEENPWR